MPRITSLTLRNFKGVSGVVDVAPLTMFCGPNDSGKSAHLEAIAWATLGTCELGDKPGAALPLMPGGGSVRVELDDGFVFERSLDYDAREKETRQSITIAGRQNLGVNEARAAIAEHCGSFAPMFDLSRFLDLSDDKRRQMVLELCSRAAGSAGACDSAAVLAWLDLAVLSEALGDGAVAVVANEIHGTGDVGRLNAGQLVAVVGRLTPQVDARHRDALTAIRAIIEPVLTDDAAASLLAAIDRTREAVNESKGAGQRGRAAAEKLAAEKATYTVGAETVLELSAQRDRLIAQRGDIKQQIGNQEGRATSIREASATVAACNQRIETARGEAKAARLAPSGAAKLTALRAEVAGMAEPPPPDEAAEKTARINESAARKLHAAAMVTHQKARGALANATSKAENVKAQLAGMRASAWVEALRLCVEAQDALVVVGGSPPELDDLHKYIEYHARPDAIEALTRESTALVELVADCQHADTEAGSMLADAAKAVEGTAADLERISTASTAAARNRAAWQMRHGELQREINKLENAEGDRTRTIAGLEQSIADDQARERDATTALERLRSEGGLVPIADLHLQLAGIDAQIVAVNGHIEALTKYRALDVELAKIIAAAELDGLLNRLWKVVGATLRAQRERIMAALVEPLIANMNRVLAVAAPGMTAYCGLENHAGNPVCDFGWSDGTKRFAIDQISRSGKARLGAALAFAMVRLADPPLKMLMIEAAEVDQANLTRLMDGVAAVAGDLGNVLLATWIEPPARDGWAVQRLAERATAYDFSSYQLGRLDGRVMLAAFAAEALEIMKSNQTDRLRDFLAARAKKGT